MNIEKVFQLTLKNYIFEENFKNSKNYYHPKIVVFSKDISILNLYYEIFMMKKSIIVENEVNNGEIKSDDKNKIESIINHYFQNLLVANKENFENNKIFNENNPPFYLCLQKLKLDINKNENGDDYILLLNEQEKNKKLKEILSDINSQNNFPNEQIILKLFWNPKYTNKLKNYLKPEKIDLIIKDILGIKPEIIDSTIKPSNNPLNQAMNNNIQSDIDIQLALRDRYNKLYENSKAKNNNTNENINNINTFNDIANQNIKYLTTSNANDSLNKEIKKDNIINNELKKEI